MKLHSIIPGCSFEMTLFPTIQPAINSGIILFLGIEFYQDVNGVNVKLEFKSINRNTRVTN